MVVVGEVVAEQDQPREVDLTPGDLAEHHGKTTGEARGGDATESFAIAEAQSRSAEVEERRVAAAQVEAPLFDLAEQQEEPRELLPLGRDDGVELTEQLVVGEAGERAGDQRQLLLQGDDNYSCRAAST